MLNGTSHITKTESKKEKLLQQVKKAEEQLRQEQQKAAEAIKKMEIEIDQEIVKIVRASVKNGKYLGDIVKEIKALI